MKAWEAKIRHVTPYTPGEQPNRPDMVKLNTNENPYPPAPEVREALYSMETDTLRLYPDPAASQLTEELARFYGLTPEQVFVGVGSDDVLAMCFLTFFNSGKPVLFPDITYSFYHVWAELFRVPYERPALDERLHLRKEDYYRENGGVIFPNPNAPTGVEEPLEEIEDILKHNTDVIVIVDEAYVDFGTRSAVELIETYENMLVVQTFSKSRSLAGLRIGYALGNPALIRALSDVKYSFNSYTLNRPALEAGAAALRNETYWRQTLKKIIATREQAKKRLGGLGFTFEDSQANFLFVTHPVWNAETLFQALRKNGIYVRYFKQPRIDQYLRITIGTEEEMDRLYAFLENYQEEMG